MPPQRRATVAGVAVALATALPVGALAVGWTAVLDGLALTLLAVVAGYAAGAWLPLRVAVAVVPVVAGVLAGVNQLADAPYHWLDDAVFFLALVAGPAAAGRAVTVRAAQVARLGALADELAEQQRLAVAAARLEEQTRVQERVQRGLAERLAAIAVRAEGAQRVGDTASLGVLETEARAVLDEVRDVLGSLATPDPAPPSEASPGPGRPAAPALTRLDLVLAGALALAMAVEMVVHPLTRGPAWVNAVAGVLLAATVVPRRRHPVVSLGVCLVLAVGATAWLTPVPATVTSIALLSVLVYSLGAWSATRWWVLAWAATAGTALLLDRVSPSVEDANGGPAEDLMVLGWLGVAVLLGRLAAGWHARARRTAEVVAALEAGRDAATRLATARERQALASRLHDTVAHSMTVVCLQAAAGRRHGVGEDEALRTIAATAAAGVAELRDGLEAIAAADALDGSALRALGMRVGVDVTVGGAPSPPPAGPAAVLVHRVVREALVNVARHAPGAGARVSVARRGPACCIEVVDEGGHGGPAVPGTGAGLAGLARTVSERGGELTWGPHGRGFRVDAVVPVVPDGPDGADVDDATTSAGVP